MLSPETICSPRRTTESHPDVFVALLLVVVVGYDVGYSGLSVDLVVALGI